MTIPVYSNSIDQFISDLTNWYNTAGQNNYDEIVTLSDHMLQAATIAYNANMNESSVVSCLLHDIGHLIIDDKKYPIANNDKNYHEMIGANYLSKIFTDDVVGPVNGHVNAKRWLCTTDKHYYDKLSPASQKSFYEQGGYMTVKEMANFSSSKYFHSSVKVREIDDRAKEQGKTPNPIKFYRTYIDNCLIKK